ncbi:LOW QUALITY PROTEIN: hypothetical protein PHMEG_00032033 [Phytophthora megakarya]|uniref:Uncharacterized protein n=1 Tax=Phytophthora megakarya TaxID=4795 RepID=A0A225UWW3_9STRA|nr:LOW QUALITY PROTEIN: hypothetical protein PHMEG_00032033 [Phytophthora megakarya]
MTAEIDASDDGEETDQGISINLLELDLNQKVTNLIQADTWERNVERRCGKGNIQRFSYYLPFVGAVCRPSFARCLDGTPLTVRRYKTHVNDGNISAQAHTNLLNKNAAGADVKMARQVVHGFRSASRRCCSCSRRNAEYGKRSSEEMIQQQELHPVTSQVYVEFVYDEMEKYFGLIRLRVRAPARFSMRKPYIAHTYAFTLNDQTYVMFA